MAIAGGRYFPVEIMHFGQTGAIATFNESTLNNGGAGPWTGNLGQIIESAGAVYRLVQHKTGGTVVATAAGNVCYWFDRANSIVTSDYDASGGVDTSSNSNAVAGGYLGVVTANYYCFVQIGGLQTVGSTGATSAGALLSGSSTDGQLVSTAMGTACVGLPVAVAWGSEASNAIAAYWILGNML